MRGAAIRARIDGEKDIALAHTIASFSRAKKLERLDHYLRPHGRSKPTMLDRLKAISDRQRKQRGRQSSWTRNPTCSGRLADLGQRLPTHRDARLLHPPP